MSERYIQPLRALVQASFLVFSIILLYRFYFFINSSISGKVAILRPNAIDSFQPLSALFAVVSMIRGISVNIAAPAAIVVLVSAVLLAMLARRSFCSWVCPLGTISEWLWKLGFSRTNRLFSLSAPVDRYLRFFKHLLLLLLIIQALSWSVTTMVWYLGSPGRALADIRLFNFFRHPSLAVLPVLFLIVLSVKMRIPFCRYLCPYGALLSVVALVSPVAVQRNRSRCVACGACSSVCPSGIDVANADRVNDPECIGCCRCISYCRVHSALRMTAFSRIVIPGILYAAMVLFLFLGGIEIGKSAGQWNSRINAGDYKVKP